MKRDVRTGFPATSRRMEHVSINGTDDYLDADAQIDLAHGCTIIGDAIADVAGDVVVDVGVDAADAAADAADAAADAGLDVAADAVADALAG
ncbi:MAG TPA: hypothetical protein VEW03_05570 [Longimicrobiaceae bacterium]|nr:hypothetical protein [Longimicrobiaceae bacterium]